MTGAFADVEAKVTAGEPLDEGDARRVLSDVDLVRVGILAEMARRRLSQDVVTFGRVAVAAEGRDVAPGIAGEVRIVGRPASPAEAVRWVSGAPSRPAGVALTGFSLTDLVALAGGAGPTLTGLANSLREAGLEAVAAVPVDGFDSTGELVAAVEAVREGGLRAWRATVERAGTTDGRLSLIQRVIECQSATGALKAFAPLPRADSAETPSTGYDDVRTVAVARLMCLRVPAIQVDWPLYGPKLAQVGIAFGANDIDGIDPVDSPELGPRRAAGAEIARQIRAAGAEPVERNGRYERRS